MLSVAEINKKLAALGCSPNQFAKLATFPQQRLSEALSGRRQVGDYQLKFFERVLCEMGDLLSDVRAQVGAPVKIVWNEAARASLERRRSTGTGDFCVGIRHQKPELPASPVLTGADTEPETVAVAGGLVNA